MLITTVWKKCINNIDKFKKKRVFKYFFNLCIKNLFKNIIFNFTMCVLVRLFLCACFFVCQYLQFVYFHPRKSRFLVFIVFVFAQKNIISMQCARTWMRIFTSMCVSVSVSGGGLYVSSPPFTHFLCTGRTRAVFPIDCLRSYTRTHICILQSHFEWGTHKRTSVRTCVYDQMVSTVYNIIYTIFRVVVVAAVAARC